MVATGRIASPHRRVARWLVLAVVCVAAGAVAAAAGAWLIELVRAWRQSKATGPASGAQVEYEVRDPRVPSAYIGAYVKASVGRSEWNVDRFVADHAPATALPGWVGVPSGNDYSGFASVAYGLPFRCLRYDMIRRDAQGLAAGGATMRVASTKPDHAMIWAPERTRFIAILPMQPLYMGLLADTLVYATLFSSPWALIALRRHLRLRPGHCPHCNYNLLHDYSRPCPECGQTSASSPPASAHGEVPR